MPPARRHDRPIVEISLLASVDTNRQEASEALVEVLAGSDARLIPVRAGEGEDCLKKLASREDFHSAWASQPQLEWRTSGQLPSAGWIRHQVQTSQGIVHPSALSLSIPWDGTIDIDHVFSELISLVSPTIGFCHLFTAREQIFDPESVSGEFDDFRRNWVQFQLGLLGYPPDPRLPNIGWSTVLGDRFAGNVDPQLLRSEGFDVDPTPNGYVVRVVPKLSDVAANFDHFLWRRMTLRGLLDPSLFLIHDEPVQLIGRMGSA